MRFGVEESALADAAVAVDRAATAVAAIRVDSLSRSVTSAMPGSRSSGLAATVGDALDVWCRALFVTWSSDAEAVRTAGRWYRDAEQDVVRRRGRRAPGAA